MKIAFIAADKAGSAYYRMFLPAQGLSWLGHEVVAATHIDREVLSVDVAIGARVALPAASKIWQGLKDKGVRLIFDLDDDYWALHPSNERAYHFWTPELLDNMVRNMAIADVVTVCSEELARRIRERTDTPVVVIPNCLHAGLMASVREYRKEPGQKLRIGWAGTSSTVYELKIAARALKRIADRPDCEVALVGVPPEAVYKIAGLRHENIRFAGWLSDQAKYLTAASTFDVWVAPYRDISFNRAKFPTKALESSFLGIPLIASSILPYEEWIEDGVNGVLVREEHEWSRKLRELVEDADLREKIGDAAREKASDYILQSMNLRWEEVCQG